ncbi:MAG: hypothetical protein AAF720_07830 [Pseudomonadota bacterium]
MVNTIRRANAQKAYGHQQVKSRCCTPFNLTCQSLLLGSLMLIAAMTATPTRAEAADGYRSYGYGRPYNKVYRDKGFKRAGFRHSGFRHSGFGYGRPYKRSFYRGGYRRRGFYRHGFYRPGFRAGFGYGGFYGYPRYFYGGHFRGDTALIAAGILGGVVLIDRALEREWQERQALLYADARARELARRRFYESRGYRLFRDDEFDGRSIGEPLDRQRGRFDGERRSANGLTQRDFETLERREYALERDRNRLEERQRQLEAERRAFENERRAFEDRLNRRRAPGNASPDSTPDFPLPQSDGPPGRFQPREGLSPESDIDDLDDDLLGISERRTVAVQNNRLVAAAFDACSGEMRKAAASSGLLVAMPSAPAVADVDGEGVYRLEASFTADNGTGQSYRKTMRCAADDAGVAFLEII